MVNCDRQIFNLLRESLQREWYDAQAQLSLEGNHPNCQLSLTFNQKKLPVDRDSLLAITQTSRFPVRHAIALMAESPLEILAVPAPSESDNSSGNGESWYLIAIRHPILGSYYNPIYVESIARK